MPLPVLLTTEDVANYLKVDVVTVRRLVKRGEIPAYRVGNEYRFTESDLMEFLERQRTTEVRYVGFARAGVRGIPAELIEHILPLAREFGGTWSMAEASMATGNPLERFSQRARKVFTLATEESRKRGEVEIQPLHLLLGVSLEDAGMGRHVLDALNIQADKISALLAPVAQEAANVPQTLAKATQTAIEKAIAEARLRKHAYIGTEHVLLGLLYDADVLKALEAWQVTAEQIRDKIAEMLNSKPS